jgi:hypothetical protein
VKLGLLSDTHNQLDPRIPALFAGVAHVLHAGDVCRPSLIAELESIAPVTVALGNNDTHAAWRETEVLEAAGHRLLVEHIVNPRHPSAAFRTRLARLRPHVVVFGHTHRPFEETIDGILYLNPGSAGAPRFGLPRSICLLHAGPDALRPEFIHLA